MEVQPPDFPMEVAYTYDGIRHTYEVPPYIPMVVEAGMDGWGSRVKKVWVVFDIVNIVYM
jgi:hypothetical protein